MKPPIDTLDALNAHLALCQEILQAVEHEGEALRRTDQPSLFESYQLKKNLLPRLVQSLDVLRNHRVNWQRLNLEERARHPEVAALLRKNQDLTMKIIVMDRENEQVLLRRGLVPPREIPSVNQQRPHFVANLYTRQGAA